MINKEQKSLKTNVLTLLSNLDEVIKWLTVWMIAGWQAWQDPASIMVYMSMTLLSHSNAEVLSSPQFFFQIQFKD